MPTTQHESNVPVPHDARRCPECRELICAWANCISHNQHKPHGPTQPEGEQDIHSIICSVIFRHCKDIQLPHGIRGLEDDLTAALLSRFTTADPSTATAAPKCVKCGHSKASPDDGLCDELLPYVKKEPFGMEMCGCKCEFAEPVTTTAARAENGDIDAN